MTVSIPATGLPRGRAMTQVATAPPMSVAVRETREAYDALADAYDALTADYCHDTWLAAIDALVRGLGAPGRRLLDLACGTGKSFVPMLARGYEVSACDVSPAMASRAARKAPAANVFVADMCTLGGSGGFDVVTCLDDALNYLLAEGELAAALRTVRANLGHGGIAIWDVNALLMYRTSFATDLVIDRDGFFIAWAGDASPDAEAGCIAEATIDVFTASGPGWSRTRSVHRQRHWPSAEVARIARHAGLRVVAMLGQRHGAILDPLVDESTHSKVLFVACRDDDERR